MIELSQQIHCKKKRERERKKKHFCVLGFVVCLQTTELSFNNKKSCVIQMFYFELNNNKKTTKSQN